MERMPAQRVRDVLRAVRQVELKARRLAETRLARLYGSAFGGTEEGGIALLMVDIGSSGPYGSGRSAKRELAAEAASALAFAALRNGDRVGLVLFADRVERYVPPRAGPAQVERILREILFRDRSGRMTDLAAALAHANHVQHGRARVFLFSDFLLAGPMDRSVPDLQKRLKAASRRHDIVAVSVTDPRELRLPDVGVITLEDIETGDQIEIDTSSEKARESYRRAADRYFREVARGIRASGAGHVALSAGTPCEPALAAFLGRHRGAR